MAPERVGGYRQKIPDKRRVWSSSTENGREKEDMRTEMSL